MGNVYDGILAFKGKWRTYQERVLRESESYLEDGKIHIIAAPGAGKTVLGIELIRRCGKPCLILSPRIVIRQQWTDRIREAFLTEPYENSEKQENGREILSCDIRSPGLITSITYQTLFSGMNMERNVEESLEGREKEETDFSGFDLIKTVKEAGIGVVCLDECHHLKNEWWKALEKFMNGMGELTVIALTATPPYDSSSQQWERYEKMCGPADAEITVPELVKEGSLCPHQDYVWFNYPTKDEYRQITLFRENSMSVYHSLLEDEQLRKAAATHPALEDYDSYFDHMLDNPRYLSALLIYCQSCDIPFSWHWLELLGVREMPPVTPEWMGVFLQGFLYDDRDSFSCEETYRKELEKELRAGALADKKRISFLSSEKTEKILINSCGKLESIVEIASCEYDSMGDGLRMLILTDYIRKEYRKAVGDGTEDILTMGALPVFELLRRTGKDWKLGILCGSLIILPDSAKKRFLDETGKDSVFRELYGSLGEPLGYSEIPVEKISEHLISAVTNLFESGDIQILTGTKSLLGEGWDSPGINSLIFASNVGSYVLGNQMRGRAVRTCPQNPDKVSNIWHLVTVDGTDGSSCDLDILKRRMEGVLGVSYDGTLIENGMQRLTTVRPPFNKSRIKQMNQDTELRSRDRTRVAVQWKEAVCAYKQMETADECMVRKKRLRPGYVFFRSLGLQTVLTVLEICNLIYFIWPGVFHGRHIILYCGTAVFAVLTVLLGGSLLRSLTPMKRYRRISDGLCHALQRSGQITEKSRAVLEQTGAESYGSWLEGGTDREKTIYSDALSEMLDPVENPRYLLYRGRKKNRPSEFISVPAFFGSSREKAADFREMMRPYIGNYYLTYTRNPEGRRILLLARAKTCSGLGTSRVERRKKVKGTPE